MPEYRIGFYVDYEGSWAELDRRVSNAIERMGLPYDTVTIALIDPPLERCGVE